MRAASSGSARVQVVGPLVERRPRSRSTRSRWSTATLLRTNASGLLISWATPATSGPGRRASRTGRAGPGPSSPEFSLAAVSCSVRRLNSCSGPDAVGDVLEITHGDGRTSSSRVCIGPGHMARSVACPTRRRAQDEIMPKVPDLDGLPGTCSSSARGRDLGVEEFGTCGGRSTFKGAAGKTPGPRELASTQRRAPGASRQIISSAGRLSPGASIDRLRVISAVAAGSRWHGGRPGLRSRRVRAGGEGDFAPRSRDIGPVCLSASGGPSRSCASVADWSTKHGMAEVARDLRDPGRPADPRCARRVRPLRPEACPRGRGQPEATVHGIGRPHPIVEPLVPRPGPFQGPYLGSRASRVAMKLSRAECPRCRRIKPNFPAEARAAGALSSGAEGGLEG